MTEKTEQTVIQRKADIHAIEEVSKERYSGQVIANHKKKVIDFSGQISLESSLTGMLIHCTDAVINEAVRSEFTRAPGLSIAVFLGGYADVQVNGESIEFGARVGQPSVLLHYNSEPVRITRRNRLGERVTKVLINLEKQILERWRRCGLEVEVLLRPDQATELTFFRLAATAPIVELSREMIKLVSSSKPDDKLALEKLAFGIIEELIRETKRDGHHDLHSKAEHARTHINNTLTSPYSLEDLAAEVGMSVSNLQRAFKQTYGCTAMAYLRHQRLLLAHHLLRHEHKSISEVAAKLHYRSNSNFSSAFKREFGISPKDVMVASTD